MSLLGKIFGGVSSDAAMSMLIPLVQIVSQAADRAEKLATRAVVALERIADEAEKQGVLFRAEYESKNGNSN